MLPAWEFVIVTPGPSPLLTVTFCIFTVDPLSPLFNRMPPKPPAPVIVTSVMLVVAKISPPTPMLIEPLAAPVLVMLDNFVLDASS